MLLTHLTLYQGTPAEDTHLCEGEAHSYIFTKLRLNVSTAPFGREKKKALHITKVVYNASMLRVLKKKIFIFNTSQEQDADSDLKNLAKNYTHSSIYTGL